MQVTRTRVVGDSHRISDYYPRMTSPTETRTVRLGLVQMSCTPDPAHNMKKAVQGIREAAGKGAQIVCLQELFRSQYFCQEENAGLFDLAESIPGPSTDALCRLAA